MNSISITSGNQVQFNEGIANTDHDISLFRKAFASRCCHTCASVEPEGGTFYRCTRCFTIYCNADCQGSDWDFHRTICKVLTQVRKIINNETTANDEIENEDLHRGTGMLSGKVIYCGEYTKKTSRKNKNSIMKAEGYGERIIPSLAAGGKPSVSQGVFKNGLLTMGRYFLPRTTMGRYDTIIEGIFNMGNGNATSTVFLSKYVMPNFGVYQGEMSDNQQISRGQFRDMEGNAYQGEFKLGMFHGQGTFISASGSIVEGIFENGFLISGKFTDIQGYTFEGNFHHNPPGEGKIFSTTGARVQGTMTSPDGTIENGTFEINVCMIYKSS